MLETGKNEEVVVSLQPSPKQPRVEDRCDIAVDTPMRTFPVKVDSEPEVYMHATTR